MQKLLFITGNKHKLEEVKKILPHIEQLDIDLPEIQEIDPKEIIRAKVEEAVKHTDEKFFVEDVSLYINGCDDLPGPLIKWFYESIGLKGIVKFARAFGDSTATFSTLIGYYDGSEIIFFEGNVKGKLEDMRGEGGWGCDPIFVPEGYDKTFSELGSEEKNKVSHRRNAVEKFKKYLEEQED